MRPFLAAVLLLSAVPAFAAPSVPASAKEALEIKDFDETALAPTQRKFEEWAKRGDKEVVFVINSFGGSVFDGLDFIKAIEDSKKRHGVKTTCIVDTKAMSMGFFFLQSAACDTRLMTKRSLLLAHNASSSAEGTAEQILNELGFLQAIDLAMAEEEAARLTISLAEFKAKIAHGDWVFGHVTALEVGAIDGVALGKEVPPAALLEAPAYSLWDLLRWK